VTQRPAWRSPANLALLLFCLMVAVAVLISPLPQRSLSALGPLALGIVLYLLLGKLPLGKQTRERLLRLAPWLLALLGSVIGLAGMLGMLPAHHFLFLRLPPLARLQGYLAGAFNPNVIAGALVVLFPFSWSLVLADSGDRPGRAWGRRLLAAGLGAILLGVIALSGSRGGYLALAAMLALLLALRWPSVGKWGLALALVGVLVGGTLMGWQQIINGLVLNTTIGGLDARLEIWSRALTILSDFPFTGIGLGCFHEIVAQMYPLFLVPAGTVTHAHNLYLQVAVDLGLPGLLAYLVLVGCACYELLATLRAGRRDPWAEARLLAAACLTSLVGMGLHGLLDAAVWDNKGAFLPWVVMGLASALYRQYRQRQVEGA